MRYPEGFGPCQFKITAPANTASPSSGGGGSGGIPTGSAGGDLGGSYPGPTVTGLQGVPICVTVPSLNDVLTFDGTDWCPSPPAPTGVDATDGTTTVTGATTLTTPLGGVTAITATNAGLNFLTNVNGGQGLVQNHGSLGATETIDLANGNWHYGILNANCTFTFTGTTASRDCEFWLELIEDGTGGWTPTWPGSVVFPGGTPTHDTTAGTTTIYGFITRDGGTTWVGGVFGGSAAAVSPWTTKGDIWGFSTVDARIPVGTNGQVLTADSTAALGVSYQTPASAAGPNHVHVDNVTYSGDGSATIFILPAAPVDAYSIGVYVAGSRSQDWTLSGGLLDVLTFGSAPASGTDNISVDIAAAA